MRTLTLVMAYFKNAGMLKTQYEFWRALSPDLKPRLQVIVTDDASPKGARALGPSSPLGIDFELYRIKKKKPWNWMAARNIGAHHASGDWLLFTDMDHVLPEATLRRVLDGPLDAADVYRFSRADAPDLTPYKPHPNSWLMTRELFAAFGGFDERWAGAYGSDFDVRDRLTAAARCVVMLPEALIRYPREVVPDASTTDFNGSIKDISQPDSIRKGSEFAAAITKARKRIAAEGGPPLTLSYAYQKVF